MTSRHNDEQLLLALSLLNEGWRMTTVAEVLGRHPSNLWESVMKVYRADIEYDGKKVMRHYPSWLRKFVKKEIQQ